jgi:nicotinate-nucleotide adenylyltransferase
VFSAAEDASGPQPVIERGGFFDDLGDIASIATPTQGIVGFVVKGNVEHRAEIEIEPEDAKDATGDVAVATNESEIPAVAELLGIGRLITDEFEARDAAAFLVDRNDRFDIAETSEVVDELAELMRRLDVSAEENKSSGLDVSKEIGACGIEFGAGDADEDELTGIVGWHIEGKPDFMPSVEMISSQKIGLFGGSFDPVHHGHLIMARDAMEKLGLERVIFIPAKISPHKLERPPADAEVRCEMLEAAISGEPGFSWDACELDREGPSFAVDTAFFMQRKFPGAELYYFIGEDNLAALDTWKEIERLKTIVRFVVLSRSHSFVDCGFPVIARSIDISSTDIRNRIAQGLSVSYLLPEPSCKIIQQRRLYRNERT